VAQRFQFVRENFLWGNSVEQKAGESSPGGAFANGPALQRREKWEGRASPGGTTEVLTHTLQRCDKRLVFSSALAAEVRMQVAKEFIPQAGELWESDDR
jgi:hypothetical protein